MAVTVDTFKNQASRLDSKSARKAFAITPNDNNYLADANDKQYVTKGILATVAGNINVIFADDSAAVVIPILAGVVYPFSLKMIKSTSTTATGLFGFR
jgi:hypothetical protein